MTDLYDVTIDFRVGPENLDAAVEELLHANDVDAYDAVMGTVRVRECLAADDEFEAYRRAANVTEAQLACGDIPVHTRDRVECERAE